jgi:hypothetical protein
MPRLKNVNVSGNQVSIVAPSVGRHQVKPVGIKKRINSRNKGAVGEREFANFLCDLGVEARRGQQRVGSPDSPDVVADLPGMHVEVKRVEAGNPYGWLRQAIRDAGSSLTPIVFHRRNREEWIAILRAEDLIRLIRKGPFDP